MPEFETLRYEEVDGVAWVTLDRPEVLNAFNLQMQHELKTLWRGLRTNDDVRCIVLTGAGEKAFCVGIDRQETMGAWDATDDVGSRSATTGAASGGPWH
jgi:enoyl-CoA hydratase/carnithine racemase